MFVQPLNILVQGTVISIFNPSKIIFNRLEHPEKREFALMIFFVFQFKFIEERFLQLKNKNSTFIKFFVFQFFIKSTDCNLKQL